LTTKFIKFTLLLVGICVLAAAPVFADSTTTFTFTAPTTVPLGLLDPSLTFRQGAPPTGLEFTATAYASPGTVSSGLFGHGVTAAGTGGLGVFEGGNDRAIRGSAFIQLDISELLEAGAKSISISTSRSEPTGASDYNLFGSNVAGSLGMRLPLNAPPATPPLTAPNSTPVPNFGQFKFISVGAVSGGSLLEDLEVTTPTTVTSTEPSSAGLLMIGLGALVAAGTIVRKRHT
jgi:hypothetical protein